MILTVVASQLVAMLVAITMNVATGIIPASWHPYLWIAWPALGVFVVVGIVLAVAASKAVGDGAVGRVSAQRAAFSRRSVLGAVTENRRETVVRDEAADLLHPDVQLQMRAPRGQRV